MITMEPNKKTLISPLSPFYPEHSDIAKLIIKKMRDGNRLTLKPVRESERSLIERELEEALPPLLVEQCY